QHVDRAVLFVHLILRDEGPLEEDAQTFLRARLADREGITLELLVDRVGRPGDGRAVECVGPQVGGLVLGGLSPEDGPVHLAPRLLQISASGRPPVPFRASASSRSSSRGWLLIQAYISFL